MRRLGSVRRHTRRTPREMARSYAMAAGSRATAASSDRATPRHPRRRGGFILHEGASITRVEAWIRGRAGRAPREGGQGFRCRRGRRNRSSLDAARGCPRAFGATSVREPSRRGFIDPAIGFIDPAISGSNARGVRGGGRHPARPRREIPEDRQVRPRSGAARTRADDRHPAVARRAERIPGGTSKATQGHARPRKAAQGHDFAPATAPVA